MIVGTGVDLAEVGRIRQAVERHGERFVARIFTPGEIAYVERKANRYERFAARFAAKEAGMKAIGTGWRGGVRWRDFEVVNLRTGCPDPTPARQGRGVCGADGRPARFALSHAHRGDGSCPRRSRELAVPSAPQASPASRLDKPIHPLLNSMARPRR